MRNRKSTAGALGRLRRPLSAKRAQLALCLQDFVLRFVPKTFDNIGAINWLLQGHRLRKAPFHRSREEAVRAYYFFNRKYRRAKRECHEGMISRAVDFDYVQWPRKIRKHIRDKDVLDVGCGDGLHAIGYIIAGVKSYTGVDPLVKLNSDSPRNLRKGGREPFGWTPQQITSQFSRAKLIRSTSEDLSIEQTFDVAVLHNVTEHLKEIEEVLRSTATRLRPSGLLIFNHHNFYSWNGHHMQPKTIDQIARDDPEQERYLDWAHIRFETPEGHYIRRGLNKIKLDELRAMVDRYYDVNIWNEIPSNEQHGGNRLTEAIITRFPELTRRDLSIHHVFCVAKKKA